MKLRSVFKIVTITSVLLLCVGFVVFFYFRMSKVEKVEDFNLYSLVPPGTIAIVDSDNMVELLTGLNELRSNKHENLNNISLLFSQLKDHINALLNDTPHGFSRQMSRTLISFHEPYNNRNQVLYCRLGVGDKNIVDKFIKKYCESSFPSKYFDYKGEEIKIYAMPDDTFLAFYMTSDFMAVSYQKRLIEQVIDCKLSGQSILNDTGFVYKPTSARKHPAIIHLKTRDLHLGRDAVVANLGGWTEFSMKIDNDKIYLAGVNHKEDSTAIFMDILRKQEPIQHLPKDIIPGSSFYVSSHSISDPASVFATTHIHDEENLSSYYVERNRQLIAFIGEYSFQSATISLFYSPDTLYLDPCMVTNIPLNTPARAERLLRNLSAPSIIYDAASGYYPLYEFPVNEILSQLTGIKSDADPCYVAFHNGSLLIAPDSKSLTSYIDHLDEGNTQETNYIYDEARSNLSDSYNFLLIADLGELRKLTKATPEWIPSFFYRNSDAFDNFILTSQFTCTDNMVYPNLVLLYKGE